MKSKCLFRKLVLAALVLLSAFPAMPEDDGQVMDELQHDFGNMGEDLNSSIGEIAQNISSQSDSNKMLLTAVYILVAIGVLVVICIACFFIVQIVQNKKMKKQMKMQFDATMKLISELQTAPIGQQLSSPEHQFLGQPTDTAEMEKLQVLAEKCEKLGEIIDEHTNRRNNSKNVSELVFKILRKLGVDRKTMMLYFCASMVYDAGFLALPADFFLVEILSSEERKKMKMHVNFAANYLDFIPKEYWDIFHDASTMHHENMNGSGYPEGVSGMDIPHIARIIHVVESYVSLVSKRSYHKMFDKEGALAELRRLPGLYDGEVVDVLEQIV